MWHAAFEKFVKGIIHTGQIDVTLPGGGRIRAGDGGVPRVALRLTDPTLLRRIAYDPELGVGEGYMDGTLTIENDDLRGFLELAVLNRRAGSGNVWWQRAADRARHGLRLAGQWNPAPRARSNVAHHYDLSGELYDLFLDADKQYSCAYFRQPSDSLETAQRQKKAHIAGKLLLQPDQRVLDIGCGWGGLALTLARDHGVRVLGITLSEEQIKVARQRAQEAGLQDRVEFRLVDYRELDERFDRVVSVGMFEHVGVPHYDTYFGKVRDLLTPDGVALIHTIGRSGPPGVTSNWIARYIFPGGYVPAMSEMIASVERAGLVACDMEVWRLHYAETLRHWEQRFTAHMDRARALYDDRFCRMWRFYLIASEMSFRHGAQVVFQAQLTRDAGAVPVTREYLYRPKPAAMLSHAAE